MRRLAGLLAALGAAIPGPVLGASATLTVEVTGIQSAQGSVVVGLCPRSLVESECTAGRTLPARPGTMRFSFRDVAEGKWAVAVYHDENGNGRLDKQLIGIPAEPYGFSNDVGRIGPPTFSGAATPVTAPATTIRVRVARIGR